MIYYYNNIKLELVIQISPYLSVYPSEESTGEMSDNEADGNIKLDAPPDKDADNAGGADDAKGGQI